MCSVRGAVVTSLRVEDREQSLGKHTTGVCKEKQNIFTHTKLVQFC